MLGLSQDDPTANARSGNEPGGIQFCLEENDERYGDNCGGCERVRRIERGSRDPDARDGYQSNDRGVHAVEKSASMGILAQAIHRRSEQRDQHKRRCENRGGGSEGAQNGAGETEMKLIMTHNKSGKRRGRQQWPGSDLANRNCIHHLLLREPVLPVHEGILQVRHEHIPAAKERETDFQKQQNHEQRSRHADQSTNHSQHRSKSWNDDGAAMNKSAGESGGEKNQDIAKCKSGVLQDYFSEHRGEGDQQSPDVRDRSFSESPNRCRNDRYDGRADSSHRPAHAGCLMVSHINPSDRKDDQNGRQNETESGDPKPAHPAPNPAQRDSHLRRIRSGDETNGGEQIEKMPAIQPLSAIHQFLLHHCDMRGRSPKGGEAQSKKISRDFPKLMRWLGRWNRLGFVGHGGNLAVEPSARQGADAPNHGFYRTMISGKLFSSSIASKCEVWEFRFEREVCVVAKSIADWMREGEELYAVAMKEYQEMENHLVDIEKRLLAKQEEVNQIAQIIGKPMVEGNRRLTAQLVDEHGPNSVPNSSATIARALAGRTLNR